MAPVIVVTGVAGSGKTTVGAMLAGRLGWLYAEADDFHPEANVAKMAAGHPLTDEDRWPWLEAIGDWIDARRAADEAGGGALLRPKRPYRGPPRTGRPDVRAGFLRAARRPTQPRPHGRDGRVV